MLKVRSNVELGHPRIDSNYCDPSEAIVMSSNSGGDFIFFAGGVGHRFGGVPCEIELQFPNSTPNVVRSSIPGSTIKWRWDNDAETNRDIKPRMDAGLYDTLIISGNAADYYISNYNNRPWNPEYTELWTRHYWDNAKGGLGGGKTFLIGTHAGLDRPDYLGECRHRHWVFKQQMDNLNIDRDPSHPRVRVIPAYLAYQRYFEDKQSDGLPYPTFFEDLFTDNFHQNDAGRYTYLCMYMATLFGIDPRNVTPQPVGLPALTMQESEYIRQVCYEVLKTTEVHGINTSAWD